MKTAKQQTKQLNKILFGLEKAYEKLIQFKKEKKTELVVIRNNKIVKITFYMQKSRVGEKTKHQIILIRRYKQHYFPHAV